MRLASFVSLFFLLFIPTTGQSETACQGPSTPPLFEHVFVLVEENQSFDDVIGNAVAMPYLNQLAASNGVARNYYANTHPSINNYFFLTAGRAGTKPPWVEFLSDKYPGTVEGDTIASVLKKHTKTWKSYAEDLPAVGYLGKDKNDEKDDEKSVHYVKRHNPFAYFKAVRKDKPPAGVAPQRDNIVPFSSFEADWKNGRLPDYSFIVPNLYNDAHNSHATKHGSECGEGASLRTADDWLAEHVKPLVESDVFRHGGLLVIVFDEACDSGKKKDERLDGSHPEHGGGHIPAVIVSSKVPVGGCVSDTLYHHESVLRLSLEALGIHDGFPGAADGAPAMGEFFAVSK
jgi:hypothetical protein